LKAKSDINIQPSQLDLWGNKNDFHWREFKVAREYVRSLKLKDPAGWEELISKRKLHGTNIPSNPDTVYKNHGWKDWDDWLGTGRKQTADKKPASGLFNTESRDDLWIAAAESKWLNFFEACKKVREYGFEYREEWELFISGKFPRREALPDNIPGNPEQVYRHVGWKDWKDWLVHPDKRTDYTEFNKARDFVRSNRINGKKAWQDFLIDNNELTGDYHMTLPERPHLEYRDSEWISWEDWLGSEIPYRDFKSTRKFIHSLKLRERKDWDYFCRGKLPHKPARTENIYAFPEIAYRNNGWNGWEDWLGSGMNQKEKDDTTALHEVMIECKCKGRIKNCTVCDGKGYYTRNI